MINLFMLLMAQSQNGKEGGGFGWQTLLMFALIAVVFYFFFIRPQSKKNKELRKFRDSLKKGDRIITAGGIHGKILEVNDSNVIIETEGQGRLKIEKMSIGSTIPGDSNN